MMNDGEQAYAIDHDACIAFVFQWFCQPKGPLFFSLSTKILSILVDDGDDE